MIIDDLKNCRKDSVYYQKKSRHVKLTNIRNLKIQKDQLKALHARTASNESESTLTCLSSIAWTGITEAP